MLKKQNTNTSVTQESTNVEPIKEQGALSNDQQQQLLNSGMQGTQASAAVCSVALNSNSEMQELLTADLLVDGLEMGNGGVASAGGGTPTPSSSDEGSGMPEPMSETEMNPSSPTTSPTPTIDDPHTGCKSHKYSRPEFSKYYPPGSGVPNPDTPDVARAKSGSWYSESGHSRYGKCSSCDFSES